MSYNPDKKDQPDTEKPGHIPDKNPDRQKNPDRRDETPNDTNETQESE